MLATKDTKFCTGYASNSSWLINSVPPSHAPARLFTEAVQPFAEQARHYTQLVNASCERTLEPQNLPSTHPVGPGSGAAAAATAAPPAADLLSHSADLLSAAVPHPAAAPVLLRAAWTLHMQCSADSSSKAHYSNKPWLPQ
jgi:hypothetical protein